MEPAILMMNANCHFGTLRYPLIMYTIFVYLCRPLLRTTNKNGLKLCFIPRQLKT